MHLCQLDALLYFDLRMSFINSIFYLLVMYGLSTTPFTVSEKFPASGQKSERKLSRNWPLPVVGELCHTFVTDSSILVSHCPPAALTESYSIYGSSRFDIQSATAWSCCLEWHLRRRLPHCWSCSCGQVFYGYFTQDVGDVRSTVSDNGCWTSFPSQDD